MPETGDIVTTTGAYISLETGGTTEFEAGMQFQLDPYEMVSCQWKELVATGAKPARRAARTTAVPETERESERVTATARGGSEVTDEDIDESEL